LSFYEIEFPLAHFNSEIVEVALQQLGALSITFTDRGDNPVLEPQVGEVRLWRDTLVRALFDQCSNPTHALAALSAELGPAITASAQLRRVQDKIWEREWLNDWKSLRFGKRLWICPWSAAAPDDPNAIVIRLDPGLAFGTGTHPTTALCLEALESLRLSGQSVIDYGCGSGILAVAALKLDATHATAVDIDPQALLATRDNAERNGVSANLKTQSVTLPLGPADCVVANILAQPLIELASLLTGACRAAGTLILSGILEDQCASVVAAYQPGFVFAKVIKRDDWCCLQARRIR